MPRCEERWFCCSDVFYAMKNVETPGVSSEPWPEGDDGDSIGPYQIQKGYWVDAFRLDQRPNYGTAANPKPPAIPAPGNCISCGGDVEYPWLADDALGGIPLSEAVICLYMNRYALNEKSRLRACRGTITDVEKCCRVHNGGPSQRYQSNWNAATMPRTTRRERLLATIAEGATDYWNKARRILGC